MFSSDGCFHRILLCPVRNTMGQGWVQGSREAAYDSEGTIRGQGRGKKLACLRCTEVREQQYELQVREDSDHLQLQSHDMSGDIGAPGLRPPGRVRKSYYQPGDLKRGF